MTRTLRRFLSHLRAFDFRRPPPPASTSVPTCPGCNQEITTTQGFTECGGEGNGACDIAAYAFNAEERDARAEWADMHDGPPPSTVLCRAVVAAHKAALPVSEPPAYVTIRFNGEACDTCVHTIDHFIGYTLDVDGRCVRLTAREVDTLWLLPLDDDGDPTGEPPYPVDISAKDHTLVYVH